MNKQDNVMVPTITQNGALYLAQREHGMTETRRNGVLAGLLRVAKKRAPNITLRKSTDRASTRQHFYVDNGR
jgi:hypothetical protein